MRWHPLSFGRLSSMSEQSITAGSPPYVYERIGPAGGQCRRIAEFAAVFSIPTGTGDEISGSNDIML